MIDKHIIIFNFFFILEDLDLLFLEHTLILPLNNILPGKIDFSKQMFSDFLVKLVPLVWELSGVRSLTIAVKVNEM